MSEIKKDNSKKKFSWFDTITMLLLLFYSVMLLFLLVWAFISALKKGNGMHFDHNVLGFPKGNIFEWQWSNFIDVLPYLSKKLVNAQGEYVRINFLGLTINTLTYAGINAVLHALVPCVVSYLMVKYPCKFSSILYYTIIITKMLPIVGTNVAMLKLMQDLNLYDTRLGNWVMNFNFGGIYTLVFYGMFQGVNKELWEAAEIDGANQWTIMVRIVFPIMINTIFLIIMVYFIQFWNEYTANMLYLPSYPTLAVALFELSRSSDLSNVPMKLASYIMFMLPILVIFLIFKDKLMGNLAIGGGKE